MMLYIQWKLPFENPNAQKSNLIKEVIFSYYSQGNLYRQTQIYMQMKSSGLSSIAPSLH